MRPALRQERTLVGAKIGRLTVVGMLNTSKSICVVRCCCGQYETRRPRAIRNPKNSVDACDRCRHLDYLRRHSLFRNGIGA